MFGGGHYSVLAWSDIVSWLAGLSGLALSDWNWRYSVWVVVLTMVIAILAFNRVARARRVTPSADFQADENLQQVYRRYSRSEATRNPAIVSALRCNPTTEYSDASATAGLYGSGQGGATKCCPALQILGEAGERLPIRGQKFRIGRHSDNELVLLDTTVHRHHIEIEQDQVGTWTIVDLGGVNGCLVNGKSCKRQHLKDGDVIELGETRLRFLGPGETRR